VDVFLVGTGRIDQLHTPQYCYASDGYEILKERAQTLYAADRRIRAMRLHAEKSSDRQDVLYWYQNGAATAQHRAWIKAAAVARTLQGIRPEPLLMIRITSAIRDDGSSLDTFVPRLLPYLARSGEIALSKSDKQPRRAAAPL
jgi:EpsI family protein